MSPRYGYNMIISRRRREASRGVIVLPVQGERKTPIVVRDRGFPGRPRGGSSYVQATLASHIRRPLSSLSRGEQPSDPLFFDKAPVAGVVTPSGSALPASGDNATAASSAVTRLGGSIVGSTIVNTKKAPRRTRTTPPVKRTTVSAGRSGKQRLREKK
jgi:hypothetical protein